MFEGGAACQSRERGRGKLRWRAQGAQAASLALLGWDTREKMETGGWRMRQATVGDAKFGVVRITPRQEQELKIQADER